MVNFDLPSDYPVEDQVEVFLKYFGSYVHVVVGDPDSGTVDEHR